LLRNAARLDEAQDLLSIYAWEPEQRLHGPEPVRERIVCGVRTFKGTCLSEVLLDEGWGEEAQVEFHRSQREADSRHGSQEQHGPVTRRALRVAASRLPDSVRSDRIHPNNISRAIGYVITS
jgi:hypothetical protein